MKANFKGWGFESKERKDYSATSYLVEKFGFWTYDDVAGSYEYVEGEIYLPRKRDHLVPLLEVSPILAGAITNYIECRFLSLRLARGGIASFFVYQDDRLLQPSLCAHELEAGLRSLTRRTVKALDCILEHYPMLDESRLGSFGISLGGVRNILLVAVEPRLRANLICLAGGGYEKIFSQSTEKMVLNYLRERSETDLCSREVILQDLAEHLVSEPLDYAAWIDPASILMVNGRFDTVIPTSTTDELRKRLGGPESWIVPFGHYSSVVAFFWVIGVSQKFYAQRFEAHLKSLATNKPQSATDNSELELKHAQR